MALNNFKLFDERKGNMLSDGEYNTNAQRLNGVQSGVASSSLNNKFAYQMSLVAYAVASLMAANGFDATDNIALSTFVGNLSNSVLQKILDKASTAEAQMATFDNKWMSPLKVRQFFESKKATSLQAITGADDTTYMTPLKVRQAVGPVTEPLQPMVGDVRFSAAQFPDRDTKYIPCNGSTVTEALNPQLYQVLVDNGFVRDVTRSNFLYEEKQFFTNDGAILELKSTDNNMAVSKKSYSGSTIWTFNVSLPGFGVGTATPHAYVYRTYKNYIVGVIKTTDISVTTRATVAFVYRYTGSSGPSNFSFVMDSVPASNGVSQSIRTLYLPIMYDFGTYLQIITASTGTEQQNSIIWELKYTYSTGVLSVSKVTKPQSNSTLQNGCMTPWGLYTWYRSDWRFNPVGLSTFNNFSGPYDGRDFFVTETELYIKKPGDTNETYYVIRKTEPTVSYQMLAPQEEGNLDGVLVYKSQAQYFSASNISVPVVYDDAAAFTHYKRSITTAFTQIYSVVEKGGRGVTLYNATGYGRATEVRIMGHIEGGYVSPFSIQNNFLFTESTRLPVVFDVTYDFRVKNFVHIKAFP